MMTDLERFIELYRSFGIDCVLNATDEGTLIELSQFNGLTGMKATLSDKFGGYSAFYSWVEFDKAGTFVKQGFWE